MTKILVSLALIVLLVSFATGCNSGPEAKFMGDPKIGYPPLDIQFTDESKGEIESWEWDFDNDGIIDSTDQNPQYTYNEPGNYTVSLTVSGPNGNNTVIQTEYIKVMPCPRFADFIAEPLAGYPPLEVQFTDGSTGDAQAWEWDFNGDGIIDSTDQNPQYTYNEPGNYTVSLTVSGPNGNNTVIQTEYIKVRPCPRFADFIAEPTVGVGTTKVQFTDMSTGEVLNWAWDFQSDGIVDSNEQNPCFFYSQNGVYSVTLTITTPTCDDTITKYDYISITGCHT